MQLKRTRAVDVILVQALDCWGRSVQDMILTMAELEALGVTCLSASNTTSPPYRDEASPIASLTSSEISFSWMCSAWPDVLIASSYMATSFGHATMK